MTSDDKCLAEFAAEFAKIPIAKSFWFVCALRHGKVARFYDVLSDCRYKSEDQKLHDLMNSINGVSCSSSGSVAALVRHFAVDMKREGIEIDLGNSYTQSIVDAVDYYNSPEVARAAEKGPEARIDEAWVRAFDCNLADDRTVTFRRPEPVFASGSLKPLDLSALERRVAQWPDEYVTDTNKESCNPYVVGLLNKTNTQPTPEENIMSTFEKFSKKAIAKPTFIFGQLTDDMADSDYEAAIRSINAQIASFSDIKNSEKVKAKVKVLKESLKEVIELYDAT